MARRGEESELHAPYVVHEGFFCANVAYQTTDKLHHHPRALASVNAACKYSMDASFFFFA